MGEEGICPKKGPVSFLTMTGSKNMTIKELLKLASGGGGGGWDFGVLRMK